MSSIPETTGTSAVVHDFICLFTHDLKRKQKRWQDGKLKYHTFNKKLMVYDDRGHFVGESHWHEDGDLEDGCELALERGGAIVQVAECVGSRTQDLTELLDKRAKEVEARRANKATRVASGAISTPTSSRLVPRMHSRTSQQRPLSSLVRSPGPVGRAVIPSVSPYESRLAERTLYTVASRATSTTTKRKRSVSPPSKMGHAKALFGTQLSLSATPLSLPQARRSALSQKAVNIPLPMTGAEDRERKWESGGFSRPSQLTETDERCPENETPKRFHTSSRHHSDGSDKIGDSPSGDKPQQLATARKRESLVARDDTPQRASRKDVNPSKTAAAADGEPAPLSSLECPRSPILGSHDKSKSVNRDMIETELQKRNHSRLAPKGQEHHSHQHKIDPSEETQPCLTASCVSGSDLVHPELVQKRTPILEQSRPSLRKIHGTEDAIGADDKASADKKTLLQTSTARSEQRSDEPRTELRIKSRQRRGLVMLSENKVPKLPRSDTTTLTNGDVSAIDRSKDTVATDVPALRLRTSTPGELRELGEPDEEPMPKKTKSAGLGSRQEETPSADQDKRFEEWLGTADLLAKDVSLSSEDSSIGRTRQTTKSFKSSSKRRETFNDELLREETVSTKKAKTTEKQLKQGPRISRLARKSIKSREIIGFVPVDSIGFQLPFASHRLPETVFSAPAHVENHETTNTEAQPPALSQMNQCRTTLTPEQEEVECSRHKKVTIAQGSNLQGSLQQGEEATPTPKFDLAGRVDRCVSDGKGLTTAFDAVAAATWSDSSPAQAIEEPTNVNADAHADVDISNAPLTSPSRYNAPQFDPGQLPQNYQAGKDDVEQCIVGDPGTLDTVFVLGVDEVARVVPTERRTISSDEANTGDHHESQQLEIVEPRKRAVVLVPDNGSTVEEVLSKTRLVAQHEPSVSKTAAGDNGETLTKSGSCGSSASTDRAYSNKTSASIGTRHEDSIMPRQISNPATRGRKAAAKKDAAGMAPRTLVQLDPPRPIITRRAPVAMTRAASKVLYPTAVSGFTTANGGAWSKHAHDLLGMTRPGKATSE